MIKRSFVMAGMNPLTARQQEIVGFLRDFSRNHGYWPSIRDIQQHFGFRSTNAVAGHLNALQTKKAISRIPGQARTFMLNCFAENQGGIPHDASEVVEIPVYGEIAAGYPDGVEQGDAIGRIQIGVETLGRKPTLRTFALKVRGDSMIDAGIFDGDTVILEPREPANNDIVAALIDGATTLKRYIKAPGCPPYLKAENPSFPEIHPASELVVQGVAQAVVRKL